MKLTADRYDVPVITAYGTDWVAVDGQRHTGSLIVHAAGSVQPWSCSRYEALASEHFAPLADAGAELVIFGSGSRLRFARPEWLTALYARRIGVETMDTAAACRTYNILAGEGRRVVVALLIESPPG